MCGGHTYSGYYPRSYGYGCYPSYSYASCYPSYNYSSCCAPSYSSCCAPRYSYASCCTSSCCVPTTCCVPATRWEKHVETIPVEKTITVHEHKVTWKKIEPERCAICFPADKEVVVKDE